MVDPTIPTVQGYLQSLPSERRESFLYVLDLVRTNLPVGYEEAMDWGMICWQVPLAVLPKTYNGHPLMFAALANQKNYLSLYLMPLYSVDRYRQLIEKSDKKPQMGKSCINFLSVDELPLPEIAEIIRTCTMEKYVSVYNASRSTTARREDKS